MRDSIQSVARTALITGGASIKHRAQDAGFAAGTYVLMAWCAKTALLVFASAGGLALVPVIGPVAATAVVGAGFLALAGGAYLIYALRQRRRKVGKRLAPTTPSMSEVKAQMFQALDVNLIPLLIAGVATFALSRVMRR